MCVYILTQFYGIDKELDFYFLTHHKILLFFFNNILKLNTLKLKTFVGVFQLPSLYEGQIFFSVFEQWAFLRLANYNDDMKKKYATQQSIE